MSNWLTIVVALLIVLVIADGIRRTWKARRDRLYESPSLKKSLKNPPLIQNEKEEVPSYVSELPNGGARVVGRRDSKEQRDKPQGENLAVRAPEQTRLNLSETVPILMQPAEMKSTVDLHEKKFQRIEPTISSDVAMDSDVFMDSDVDVFMDSNVLKGSEVHWDSEVHRDSEVHKDSEAHRDSEFIADDESAPSKILSDDSLPKETLKERLSRQDSSLTKNVFIENEDDEVEAFDSDELEDDEVENKNDALDEDSDDHLDEDDYDEADDHEADDHEASDYEDGDYEDDEDYADDDEDSDDWDESDDEQALNTDESEFEDHDQDEIDDVEPLPTEPAKSSLVEAEEVIVINVMAQRAQVFDGNELLDIVLKCGLRYGSMNIFHRYNGNKGDGILLFSMANIVKPGTFDLDAMDEFTTLGVSLFLTLPLEADSLQSFELMLQTAQAISQTLGGELKDEYRSVMTKQTIEHYRQRIRDFERKKLFRRP